MEILGSKCRYSCVGNRIDGQSKDASDFDKSQIVLVGQLSQSISETAAPEGCPQSTVVST